MRFSYWFCFFEWFCRILNAREAALASRRSCVEEWIAWHARLREEENRVARMEEAALKLVSAASNAISYHQNGNSFFFISFSFGSIISVSF